MAPKCLTMPTSPTPTCVNDPKIAMMSTSSAAMPTTPRPIAGPPDRGCVPLMVMRSLLARTDAGLSKAFGCEDPVNARKGPPMSPGAAGGEGMRSHENGMPRMLSPREAADIAGELTEEDFEARLEGVCVKRVADEA